MEEEKTFYQELREKGYTRRQFLKFCGLVGVMLGLEQSGVAQVINALETKPRKPVIWLHFQECTCCSESFLRASHPLVGPNIARIDISRLLRYLYGSKRDTGRGSPPAFHER